MIGKILGKRYEVIEKIGDGGMSIVYKGKDKLLNRTVTIKVLREQFINDKDFVERFHREAQAVASLSHPNIVSIYDVGEQENLHYLVMEYISGYNLKEIIQNKAPLDPLEAIDYSMQIMDALQHAHENNIVHRDIKPHNILITETGKVKVTDFGIAQAITNATITFTGTVVGSVQYISPEQAKGEVVDHTTDIYSAGVVLYEMLTGELPFSSDTPISLAIKHIQEDVLPPSSIRDDIPISLENIVLKAMSKKYEERYGSAQEMHNVLEKVKISLAEYMPTQIISAVDKKHLEKKRKRRKPKLAFWIIAPIFLLIICFGFWIGTKNFFIVSEVAVPSLEGKSLEEVKGILEKENLKYTIGRKIEDTKYPENTVVNQSPEAGEKIKITRLIVLDISKGPELEGIPGVIGLPESQAKININNAGFKVNENISEVYDEQIPAGYVVGQDPKPETKKPLDTEVTLTISKGPEPKIIKMPDLIGKTLEKAQEILKENNLEIGEITNETNYEQSTGKVFSQSETIGSDIAQGTKINLIISKGPGANLIAKTSNVGFTTALDGLEHEYRIIVVDTEGEREQYRAVHKPGEYVQTTVEYYGNNALVKIYKDDILDQEEPLQ